MRARIQLFPLAIIIVILLFICIEVFLQKDFMTATMIILIILLLPIIFMFDHLLRKGRFSRKFTKAVTIFLGVGISLIYVILVVSTTIGERPSGNLISSSKTFLASTKTYEITSDTGEKTNFTIFESKYGFIIDQYLNSKKHMLFKKECEEILQPEWGATIVFNCNIQTYVVYDDYVVSFYSYDHLTKALIDKALMQGN